MRQIILLVLVFLMVACSNEKNQPTNTPEIIASPTLSAETRQNYEQQFESLRQLHTSMDGVWGAISRGEKVQCGEEYPLIAPEQVEQPIERELYTAALELADAVRLWQAECENPRSNIPPDVIDRGLRMVLTAGDALREAEKLLSNP